MGRDDSFANKINTLNKTFEQAEEVCSSSAAEFLEAKQSDIVKMSEEGTKDIVLDGEVIISRAEVIKLQVMVEDYREVREILLETTRNGRQILEKLTLDLMDDDEEGRASNIMAYSSMVTSINQSVKILASSYKDISAVLLNLDKLDKGKDPNITVNGDINIKNEQNNQVVSTVDLIKQLKDKQNKI